jgi:hypothetical protein
MWAPLACLRGPAHDARSSPHWVLRLGALPARPAHIQRHTRPVSCPDVEQPALEHCRPAASPGALQASSQPWSTAGQQPALEHCRPAASPGALQGQHSCTSGAHVSQSRRHSQQSLIARPAALLDHCTIIAHCTHELHLRANLPCHNYHHCSSIGPAAGTHWQGQHTQGSPATDGAQHLLLCTHTAYATCCCCACIRDLPASCRPPPAPALSSTLQHPVHLQRPSLHGPGASIHTGSLGAYVHCSSPLSGYASI